MAAPPQTIALAGLMLLNFVLAVAALCLHVLGRRRPRQQVPSPPPPPLEPAVAGEEGGGEERPQNQRRRRRARRKRQQEEEEEGAAAAAAADGGGHGADGDRDAAAKAAGKEALLPRRPQFPLASVAGALQRRINARYDDLARASEAQCLTIEQVRRSALHYPSTCFSQDQGFTCFCFAYQCVCEVNLGRSLSAWVTTDKCCLPAMWRYWSTCC